MDIKGFRPGDIVKFNDGPAEVFCVFPPQGLLFIMEKRTLWGHFVTAADVEFVRRPDKTEYRRKTK